MKKSAIVLAVVLAALPLAAQEAPTQVDVSLSVQFPGFALGPMVDFITFPIGFSIGDGMHNYLGWGGAAGIMVAVAPYFGIAVPIEGIFAGRFGFIPTVPIDFDARLGFILGASTLFFGSTDVAVQFPLTTLTGRASVGLDFYAVGGDIFLGFDLQFGVVFPLKGFKSLVTIGN